MPVSSTQYRDSSGVYQNKQYDNIKKNTSQIKNIISNHSAIQDEICHFGKNISRAMNSYKSRSVLMPQHRATSRSVIVPALLLLSQVRLPSPPSDNSSFLSDRGISLLPSENKTYSDNSDNGFNALLNPVLNALYKTGEIISRYDPLIFPAADATSLSATSPVPVTIQNRHFLSEKLAKKTNEIISTITDAKQAEAIREMINELNNITIKAEEKFPSSSSGYKNVHHFIFLIDESKYIIDKIEIKYGQETLCETLRLQREHYIEMAKSISDDESQCTFQNYIKAFPWQSRRSHIGGGIFPSFESQIADNLVSRVFGFGDGQGETSVYGSHHDAYKSLLTQLLTEKKINNINDLPDDWEKNDEDIRLVNLLLRDVELNLNNKGWWYLLKPATIFCQFYHDALKKDSTLSDEESMDRRFESYFIDDQFHLLINTLKKPIKINYNQQPDSPRFLKLLDLFATIQCITEAMHPGHQPTGKNDILCSYSETESYYNMKLNIKHNYKDFHHAPGTDTHPIRSYQQCKNAQNLKPEYNSTTHELILIPTSGRSVKLKENRLEMDKILRGNERINEIKFMPIPSLRKVKNHSSVSPDVKTLVTPEMYVKNKDKSTLSKHDILGLIHDAHGNRYLEIDEEIIKVKNIAYLPEIKNRFIVEDKGNNTLYLRFQHDNRFHPENITERLTANQIIDFGEITSDVEPLTSDERHALRIYGRTGPSNINNFITKGVFENDLASNSTASMLKTIDDIQHAVEKITPYKGVVYKYIIMNVDEFNSLQNGQLLTSTTFLSCTKNIKVANRELNSLSISPKFTDTLTPPDNLKIIRCEFNIIKSGHPLEWYTENFYAEEVLIERNKYFKIKNFCSDNGMIVLDEIGSSLLSDEEITQAKNIDSNI